jgi:hypothetical protein
VRAGLRTPPFFRIVSLDVKIIAFLPQEPVANKGKIAIGYNIHTNT